MTISLADLRALHPDVFPTPSPVIAAFFAGTTSPTQAQLDFLVKRHRVPNMALAYDGDRRGWLVQAAQIVPTENNTFIFANSAETMPKDARPFSALVFVARDAGGDALDIVAWRPRENDVRSLYGRAALLGEHAVFALRLAPQFQIHNGVLGWLRAGRCGGVIVHAGLARRCLEGITVVAHDVDHGERLRQILKAPPIAIKVPATRDEEAMQAAQRCLESTMASTARNGRTVA